VSLLHVCFQTLNVRFAETFLQCISLKLWENPGMLTKLKRLEPCMYSKSTYSGAESQCISGSDLWVRVEVPSQRSRLRHFQAIDLKEDEHEIPGLSVLSAGV
jgi:hypothetical protein